MQWPKITTRGQRRPLVRPHGEPTVLGLGLHLGWAIALCLAKSRTLAVMKTWVRLSVCSWGAQGLVRETQVLTGNYNWCWGAGKQRVELGGDSVGTQRRLGLVRQASCRSLWPEPWIGVTQVGRRGGRAFCTSTRACRLGNVRCYQGLAQRQGGELVGEYLARLVGAWLDPKGLREPQEGFNWWCVRMIPRQRCGGGKTRGREAREVASTVVQGRGDQTKQEWQQSHSFIHSFIHSLHTFMEQLLWSKPWAGCWDLVAFSESLQSNRKGHQPTAHGTVSQPVISVIPWGISTKDAKEAKWQGLGRGGGWEASPRRAPDLGILT